MKSSEWYNSLEQDLWESVFYAEVVTYVERAIASGKGETNIRELIGVIFEIQKLETIIAKGVGTESLKNSICRIVSLLKAWGFSPTDSHRQAMLALLKKNAISDSEIENIISCF